jgi:hypothetical protein
MLSPSVLCFRTENTNAGKSRAKVQQLSDQLKRDQRSKICQIFHLPNNLKERIKDSVTLLKHSGIA